MFIISLLHKNPNKSVAVLQKEIKQQKKTWNIK